MDSRGRSYDVEGLYIADSSLLPTSLGVNPCYTVYALARHIAQKMVDEINTQVPDGALYGARGGTLIHGSGQVGVDG